MLHNVTMLSSRPPSVVCPKFRSPKDHNNSPPPFKVQVKKAYISYSMCFRSVCTLHLHCVPVFRYATQPFTTFRFRALHPPQHLAAQDSATLLFTTSLPFHFAPRMLSHSLQDCKVCNICNLATFYHLFYPSIRRLLIPFPLIRFVRCPNPSYSARFITAVMPLCPAISFPELTFYGLPSFCYSLSFYFLSSNLKTKIVMQ